MTPYYEQDGCTIYCGDCREIMPSLGPVDHVVTDPPYEAEAHTMARRVQRGSERGTARTKSEMRVETLAFPPITDTERDIAALSIATLAKRWALVFCQAEAAHKWEAALVTHGMQRRRWCVWTKPDGQPQFSGDRPGVGYETLVACHALGASRWNGGGRLGVFSHVKNVTGSQFSDPHPTTKPEPLMRELVELFTDVGDLVLDPFMGSGTTLVACKRLARRAIGIELNEPYCEIAANRLRQAVLPFAVAPEATQADLLGGDAA